MSAEEFQLGFTAPTRHHGMTAISGLDTRKALVTDLSDPANGPAPASRPRAADACGADALATVQRAQE